MRDIVTLDEYGEYIAGVHVLLPRLLRTFDDYKIKATFATVGFLFFETKKELLSNLPVLTPQYKNKNLSPYEGHFETVGADFNTDKYHFAPQLIKLIQQYPEQEIGSHTFSHYYCLEEGQNLSEFRADIQQAVKVAAMFNITLTSLIFPRNQFNEAYLNICKEFGICCYRGNEQHWIYKAKNGEEESKFRRALRLMDAYINISGHNCHSDDYIKSTYPFNIPASRFLRPFSPGLKTFEKWRLERIKSGMTYAAKNNLTYHLWWHPHNFGMNQDANFSFLESLLTHYRFLNKEYNFCSYTMSELATKIQYGA